MSCEVDEQVIAKMDKRTLVELLGVAGVIASLVFVGIEIRQGAAATRSATVLQLKDAWAQLNLAEATNVELNKAFETVIREGLENAGYVAQAQVGGWWRTLFHNTSNAYYQYRIGTLDEDLWIPHLREMKTFPDKRIAMQIWANWKHLYDDPFRELMDEIIERAAQ